MKAVVMANQALNALKIWKESYETNSYNSYCSTQFIANNFKDYDGNTNPLKASQHQSLRTVLERLYHAGVLEKDGVPGNKTKWRLIVDTWDRRDPFKRQGPAPEASSSSSSDSDDDSSSEELKRKDERIEELEEVVRKCAAEISKQMDQIKELEAKVEAKDSGVKTIVVKRYDGKTYKLKEKVLPRVFNRVKDLCEQRRNVLLVGPAGCGKTYLAKLVADVLGLEFASLSCTSGMSEAHLLGRAVPDLTHGKNRFQGTDFLRVYETGGIGLLDELDAADPNLLLAVNTGLANGYMNVPNRPDDPRAIRHKDFVCIGTANTFGRGATRMYSGRNQLDEATLDRFRIGIVECNYDDIVERTVCPDEGKGYIPYQEGPKTDMTIDNLIKLGYGIRGTCQYIRHKIEAAGLRRIMSTRFMEDAWVMHSGAEWDLRAILEVFFEGWTNEEKAKVA